MIGRSRWVMIENRDRRDAMPLASVGDLRRALTIIEARIWQLRELGDCRSIVVVVHEATCDHEAESSP